MTGMSMRYGPSLWVAAQAAACLAALLLPAAAAAPDRPWPAPGLRRHQGLVNHA